MSYRGRLSNVSPVYTGKNMFKIVLDKKPVSKIYFKEFSADTYNNGKWTSEAEENVRILFLSFEKYFFLWIQVC